MTKAVILCTTWNIMRCDLRKQCCIHPKITSHMHTSLIMKIGLAALEWSQPPLVKLPSFNE